MKGLKSKIREACSKLSENTSLIVMCPPESLGDLRVAVLGELFDDKSNGVYVSLNKPYSSIDHTLKKAGLKTSSIYYIDCITTLVAPGKPDKKNPRVFHVSSPASIAEEGLLSKEIEWFIDKVPHPKFIVIDTLRTLALYHQKNTVTSLMHHILKSAEKMRAKVVALTIIHPNDKTLDSILPLFDVILNISE
ncbi:MAG: hypothetical protein V1703_03525 [Candidatus Altiarchaeota archaeon]